ncbi:hypothetical protein IQ249_22320 [Lusitaniella coriacea LEGE 07157]|uniref:Uncharacterized protein n=1 Tax=Lusitaniella coriacea LEGE 07157 TaxID=945747 RepID=A0A8J7DZP9_9CYAN|nr:hypothetical protein [Lusitaniella coriacea]MBE9118629.1 hypothetical protein [Lusitaniella coriacea LEGE 07157]
MAGLNWTFDNDPQVVKQQQQALTYYRQAAYYKMLQYQQTERKEYLKTEAAEIETRIAQADVDAKRPLLQAAQLGRAINAQKLQQKRYQLQSAEVGTAQAHEGVQTANATRMIQQEISRGKLTSLAIQAQQLRVSNEAVMQQLSLSYGVSPVLPGVPDFGGS